MAAAHIHPPEAQKDKAISSPPIGAQTAAKSRRPRRSAMRAPMIRPMTAGVAVDKEKTATMPAENPRSSLRNEF